MKEENGFLGRWKNKMTKTYYCPKEIQHKTVEEARDCQYLVDGRMCPSSSDEGQLCNVIHLSESEEFNKEVKKSLEYFTRIK